jgi:TRAP-type C4-dicarboxylate transport system permease small subunit
LKYYHKFAGFCYTLLRWIAVVTMVVMLILMVTEVIRRYLLNLTWIWSEEIISYLMVYCAYFGGTAAYYKHSIVSFDLITSRLPKKVQDILLLIGNFVLMIFFGFLLYSCFLKMTNPSTTRNISVASGISASVPYYGIFGGLIFLLIFTLDFYPSLIRRVFFGRNSEGAI